MKRMKISPKQLLWIVAVFLGGFLLRGCFVSPPAELPSSSGQAQPSLWTCSMHPQIKLPKPGKCPICFMDLIPLTAGGADEESAPRRLSVSENALRLMEIETARAERRAVSTAVRMVGMVGYDETRLARISAWVGGRIDRLFVDYTGVTVAKGDPLVSLYSPGLFSAQTELLLAVRGAERVPEEGRQTAQKTADAVREKLRLWGLTLEQIAEIEARGTADEHVTVYSPSAGVVVDKEALEGMYVETGGRIYTIADLSTVWIKLDAYESDLAALRPGQAAEFTAESWPGELFTGTVEFIDPVLAAGTRTAKVRLSAPNPDMKLKPGMFVRATVAAEAAADGGELPLVIPASAPLLTGRRAVVYVKGPDAAKPLFEGREVELGPRAGDFYVVRSGLVEGEQVVTRGAFKIDSELQIQAKPSMMSAAPVPAAPHAQSHCPVMGGAINKEIFTDFQGQRIYFCCPGCIGEFQADPEKYLEKMGAEGVEPEKTEGHHAH